MRALTARKNADPNDPNPLQPRRREYLASFYEGKSQPDLIADQQKIAQGALEGGRHVYIVGTKTEVASFEQQFFPGNTYTLKTIARWNDQIEPLFGQDPPKPGARPRTGRGFNPRRGNRPGPRGNLSEWMNSSYEIVEVTLKSQAQ
jgi:hypothetical protein